MCVKEGMNARDKPCGNIVSSIRKAYSKGTVLSVVQKSCLGGNYKWVNIQLAGQKVWVANVGGVSVGPCEPKKPSKTSVDHDVPYVHQLYDTPDSFCGNWACGPTSTVMALAFYNRIKKRPITVTKLFNHTSDFGFYVSSNWTSSNGFTFDRMQTDACDRPAWGAYGTGTDGGLAWAWRLQELLSKNGLASKFYESASIPVVKNALANGRLVIMSTRLTKGGHVVLAKGYDGDLFIINDPYGDRREGPENYGKKHNGMNVNYSWDLIQGDLTSQKPKWMIEIIP